MGSTRNFIPYNYKSVFALLFNLNWHLPAIQTLFLLNLVVLCKAVQASMHLYASLICLEMSRG